MSNEKDERGKRVKTPKKRTHPQHGQSLPPVRKQKGKVSANWSAFLESEGKTVASAAKGKKPGPPPLNPSRSHAQPMLTKAVSLDCEMVSDMEDNNMLGRVSIVNYNLQCVYDKYVKPTSPVGDYRTRFSGLRESDLENGVEFRVVQREIRTILRDRILVGHALWNDLRVLKLWHPKCITRDTARYDKFREGSDGKTPGLKKLAKVFLNEDVQDGEHCSIEDASTAMKLYKKYRYEWEAHMLNEKGKKKKKKSETM